MIKINLLGDETAVDHSSKLVLVGFIASWVILLGLFVYLHRDVKADVEEKTNLASDLQSQLDTLKAKTKTVQELDKKKQILNSKLALVAKLKKSKIGPVRVLDDLNTAVPAKVWLRQVIEKDGMFSIKGRALNNQDIALFMKNLDSSDYFQDVELQESRQMLYSKRSGKVIAQTDLNTLRGQSGDFRTEGRTTKESPFKGRERAGKSGGKKKTWAVLSGKKGKSSERDELIDEHYVRIKEFRLSAKVQYHGKVVVAGAAEAAAGRTAKRK